MKSGKHRVSLLILLCLMVVGLAGCHNKAYSQSIEKGLNAVAENKYQKALTYFDNALAQKPKDEKAQAYRDQTQAYLTTTSELKAGKVKTTPTRIRLMTIGVIKIRIRMTIPTMIPILIAMLTAIRITQKMMTMKIRIVMTPMTAKPNPMTITMMILIVSLMTTIMILMINMTMMMTTMTPRAYSTRHLFNRQWPTGCLRRLVVSRSAVKSPKIV